MNHKVPLPLWSSATTTTTTTPSWRPRRVVVTGLGLVSSLGTGVHHNWQKLINPSSSIANNNNSKQQQAQKWVVHSSQGGMIALNDESFQIFPSRVAAVIPRGSDRAAGQFDVDEWVPLTLRSQTTAFIELSLSVATQALRDAAWKPQSEEEQIRTGVLFGSGIGSLEEIVSTSQTLFGNANSDNEPSLARGYKRVSPYFIPRILINLSAGQISIMHQLKGPNHSVTTACATGAHAIGDAYRMIQRDDADVMVAGAAESCVNALALAGFCRMKALSTKFNDQPERASRPFDKQRDGFVLGEGAGAVVLEEREHAIRRGARIYAEIRGYGLSGDANHITSPSEDGDGAWRCMMAALKGSGLEPHHIDYVNAHATSTPLGDAVENLALRKFFAQDPRSPKDILVSSTKGATGHCLGAAGAIEAVFSVLALHHGMVPPTLNLDQADDDIHFNLVPKQAIKANIQAALTNSFGFGGTNTSLLFTRP